MPYLRDLGNWNLAIGMGLISLGFVFATKWE
jgi:Cell division protein CrgA